ncbi:MAG: type II secretion system F family protein, partial [Pirellulales bacterium]
MKHYYKAKARDGAVTSGELEAGSQAEARRMLREQGLFALEVSAAGRRPAGAGKPSRSLFAQRVGKGDVLLMLSQLNIMCQSGVDLAEALRGIASQSQNPRLKETQEKVHYDVTSGQTFSESLGKHKDI